MNEQYTIEIKIPRGWYWLLHITNQPELELQKAILDQTPVRLYRDGNWREIVIASYRLAPITRNETNVSEEV